MLWIALCVATATILFFSVEHFVPSTVECILRGLKPLLLLLQAPRGGDKPSMDVLFAASSRSSLLFSLGVSV